MIILWDNLRSKLRTEKLSLWYFIHVKTLPRVILNARKRIGTLTLTGLMGTVSSWFQFILLTALTLTGFMGTVSSWFQFILLTALTLTGFMGTVSSWFQFILLLTVLKMSLSQTFFLFFSYSWVDYNQGQKLLTLAYNTSFYQHFRLFTFII